MSRSFLGLDAGNAKTVVLVADADGRVLGRGRSGNGDIYGAGGAAGAEASVLAAVRAAVAEAGVGLGDLDSAAFRLAGVDWPEDEDFWRRTLQRDLPELSRLSVRNDGYSLLRCHRPDGVGVAVTAGSGPAVAARGPDGREFCACWWIQHPLAGYGLGRAALTAVVDAELGAGPATALTAALLAFYAYPDVEALLHAFTRRVDRRPEHDSRAAARTVLRVAGEGDPVAVAIVADQADVFARLSRVAAERAGLLGPGTARAEPVPVVLGGSVLTSELPAYRDQLLVALERRMGAVQPVLSSAAPVAGALLDALDEGGVPVDAAVQERVLTALHPADFLTT